MDKMKIFSYLLRTNSCFDFEEYDSFKKNVLSLETKLDEKSKNISTFLKENPEDENLEEGLCLQIEAIYSEKNSFQKAMYKTLIILLYSSIEIKMKEILKLYSLINGVDITITSKCCFRRLFRSGSRSIDKFYYNDIKKKFDENFSGIFSRLSRKFKEFEELRLLNNCLKHSEIVDKKLREINQKRWHKGSKIEITKEDLERLESSSKSFVSNLIKNIISNSQISNKKK